MSFAISKRGSTDRTAANDSPGEVMPAERMSWLVELMSRYAREFAQSSDGHESPRIAAAIVAHLRSLSRDLPNTGRLTEATEHWTEMWESILSQHLRKGDETIGNPSLRSLIKRAQAF
jgi:hypothetical protein